MPGVTIIRPLKGPETKLYDTLECAFRQNYPNVQIIMSVASENDQALVTALQVKKNNSHINSMVIVGDIDVGPNPKVCNMVKAFDEAIYDVIWVLDSNVWVDRNCLLHSVQELMRDGVELVHHLPVGCSLIGAKLGSLVEEIYMCTFHAKFYRAINAVAIAPCVMGKSNIFRKSSLLSQEPRGVSAFGAYIGEDQLIAEKLWMNGKGKHVMTNDIALQVLENLDWASYCSRRERWIRGRKYMVTAATLIEPFTESIVLGLIGAWGFSSRFGISMFNFFILHMFVDVIVDFIVYFTLRTKLQRHFKTSYLPEFSVLPPISIRFLAKLYFAWIVRETTALPLWLVGIIGSKVRWRGQNYILKRDMTFVRALN